MTEVRELATGLRFPEGPIAMDDGSVVLVEIERERAAARSRAAEQSKRLQLEADTEAP